MYLDSQVGQPVGILSFVIRCGGQLWGSDEMGRGRCADQQHVKNTESIVVIVMFMIIWLFLNSTIPVALVELQ